MSLSGSSTTTGFIDLATYDEPEKYMYGGPDAVSYFVRVTRKATWFTQVPVTLARSSGTADFGQQWSATINRSGDYLLYAWLRVEIPSVQLNTSNPYGVDGRLRWTRNLMHNLIQDCTLTFNSLIAARFNNFHLDFWAAFTTPAGKLNGYNNMIGNIDDLTQPHDTNTAIPSAVLNLPLPFFFQRDSGVALPTAALPYNDIQINFSFRDYTDLLIVDDSTPVAGTNPSVPVQSSYLAGGVPSLSQAQVWANYAIVSSEERKKMGCAPRDILIEQAQFAPVQTFNPSQNVQPQYDLRFSHAVKVIFFAVRNRTCAAEWSNYTAASPVPGSSLVDFAPSGAVDPIVQTSLTYESSNRLSQMGSDYFSLVQPYFHAPVVPLNTGYHMYSYALDFINVDPTGSTNYGKLSTVSITPRASSGAETGSAGSGAAGSGQDYAQLYDFIVTVVNNNIIRISGGALGFPVL